MGNARWTCSKTKLAKKKKMMLSVWWNYKRTLQLEVLPINQHDYLKSGPTQRGKSRKSTRINNMIMLGPIQLLSLPKNYWNQQWVNTSAIYPWLFVFILPFHWKMAKNDKHKQYQPKQIANSTCCSKFNFARVPIPTTKFQWR